MILILQNIDFINHASVKSLKEQLAEDYYHPLDRNDTPDYLKNFAHIRRFIRIRGSEYYGNPTETINRVLHELSGYEIEPEGSFDFTNTSRLI